MMMVFRLVVFGLMRRIFGLPGMALIGLLLYLYYQNNFG